MLDLQLYISLFFRLNIISSISSIFGIALYQKRRTENIKRNLINYLAHYIIIPNSDLILGM